MKKQVQVLITLLLIVSMNINAQFFPVDTTKLNCAYRELISKPNTLERQKAFFNAFPGTWNEFITTYQYVPNNNYDNTMYFLAKGQIDALKDRVTLIEDSIYCQKLVNIAIGAVHEADAPNYFQSLLHGVMWEKMDVMLHTISQLRKGYQMLFWQFYWSNPVKATTLETEFDSLMNLISEKAPEQMKIMKIAYDYFYDGINIDGGYLDE